jgi:hypothetical protein
MVYQHDKNLSHYLLKIIVKQSKSPSHVQKFDMKKSLLIIIIIYILLIRSPLTTKISVDMEDY